MKRLLPDNIDRLPNMAGGYRYVAYSRHGRACRLQRQSDSWLAYETLSGRYIGRGDTLVAIGAMVASHLCEGDS
jgi:hypothetical protein